MAVIPFECVEDGTIEPIVAIIPRGYDTQAYLPNLNGLLNVMRLSGSRVTVRHYGNCTQILIEQASDGMLIDFITYLLGQKCPVLITTAKCVSSCCVQSVAARKCRKQFTKTKTIFSD